MLCICNVKLQNNVNGDHLRIMPLKRFSVLIMIKCEVNIHTTLLIISVDSGLW